MLGAYQLPYHFISVNLGTLRLTISTPTLATWLQLETLMDFQNNISDMDFFYFSYSIVYIYMFNYVFEACKRYYERFCFM